MKRIAEYLTHDKVKRIVVAVIIFTTLIFIFARSAKTPEQSTAESDKVADIVGAIIPPTTEAGLFINNNIRKIAHFLEYGLLGVECTFYVYLFEKDRCKGAFLMGVFGFASAFFDETVQIFSGRGPSVSDVWLDMSGFACISMLVALGLLIYGILTGRRAKNKTKTEN